MMASPAPVYRASQARYQCHSRSHSRSVVTPLSPPPLSPRSKTQKSFSFLYGSLYTFLFFLLLVLLLVSPADIIRQAADHQQYYNVIVIGVAYVVTVVIVAFIYATRLYFTRNILAGIPKTGLLLGGSSDIKVDENVKTVIDMSQSRCAAIALDSKPRAPIPDLESENHDEEEQQVLGLGDQTGASGPRNGAVPGVVVGVQNNNAGSMKTASGEPGFSLHAQGICLPQYPQYHPTWGVISHPGWSGPDSPDFPNIQYSAVLSEVPNLIEAKALTLAPSMASADAHIGPLMPDKDIQAVLQRQGEYVGLRDYLTMLASLGVLGIGDPLVEEFLHMYEKASFSTRPVEGDHFRRLMNILADLLRTMRPLSGSGHPFEADLGSPAKEDSDPDDPAPKSLSPTTTRSHSQASLHSQQSKGSVRKEADNSGKRLEHVRKRDISTDADGNRQPNTSPDMDIVRRPHLSTRTSNTLTSGTHPYRTAPSTPTTRLAVLADEGAAASIDSDGSFAQTRRPLPFEIGYSSSGASSPALKSRQPGFLSMTEADRGISRGNSPARAGGRVSRNRQVNYNPTRSVGVRSERKITGAASVESRSTGTSFVSDQWEY